MLISHEKEVVHQDHQKKKTVLVVVFVQTRPNKELLYGGDSSDALRPDCFGYRLRLYALNELFLFQYIIFLDYYNDYY